MVNPVQLPFKQAIKYHSDKIKLPTSDYTSIWEQQHAKAFVVAGAQSDALLEDIYNAVWDAKQHGGGYQDFKLGFPDIATKHGWEYNGVPGWRSRVIYNTNVKQAYNAGRWQQMESVKHLRPFLQYDHTSIEHPRLIHKAWDEMIFEFDDPIVDIISPQNGYGCNCRWRSLSRTQAEKFWTASGKNGPDKLVLKWETKIVGKRGSQPREVLTPEGIDPGFAYNPGKAYLEPLTVPPLQGYDAVLKERGAAWPTSFKRPELSKPMRIDKSVLLPADTEPAAAVSDFLDVFGADLDVGSVFTDAANTSLVISKALFTDGAGDFKWLAKENKANRLQYINLLAWAIAEPDEIWWAWVKDNKENGRWRLKRRYLKAFEIEGTNEYAMAVFEWGRTGWTGATTFMQTQKTDAEKLKYFDKQRIGRMVYKK